MSVRVKLLRSPTAGSGGLIRNDCGNTQSARHSRANNATHFGLFRLSLPQPSFGAKKICHQTPDGRRLVSPCILTPVAFRSGTWQGRRPALIRSGGVVMEEENRSPKEQRSLRRRGKDAVRRISEPIVTAHRTVSGQAVEQNLADYNETVTQVLLGLHDDLGALQERVEELEKKLDNAVQQLESVSPQRGRRGFWPWRR